MDSTSKEQWVLDQFMHGLSNVDMRKHVTFGHPIKLSQAISLATEYEAFQAGNKDKLRKPAHTSGDINAISATSDKKDSSYSPSKSYQSNDNRNQASPSKTQSDSSQSAKIQCRYCKKTNHVIEDCRKLKWKKEQEAKLRQNVSESPSHSTRNQGN